MKYEKPTPEEIKEENRKIQKLRILVDLTISLISRGNLTRDEAIEYFNKVKEFALELFPGKEEEFEIIYAPRFKRIISQIYGLH